MGNAVDMRRFGARPDPEVPIPTGDQRLATAIGGAARAVSMHLRKDE